LVPEVDFVSGPGPDPALERRLITNLGVFSFGAGGWSAASLHEGITAEDVAAQTGFAIDCSSATSTPTLTDEECNALAAVDPDNLRGLEAAPDMDAMGQQIAAERSAWHAAAGQ
jgi:hypothetical protein